MTGAARYRVLWYLALPVASLAAPGCGEPGGGFAIRQPDMDTFETEIMPILSRDCAFHACHGAPGRFFQFVGPGRPRLSPTTKDSDPLTADELRFDYDRARSMIDRQDPSRSLLLLKPLAADAGGYGHLGTDQYGRDVFDSKADPSFIKLQDWILAAPLEPNPLETEAMNPPTSPSTSASQPGAP